MNIPPISAFFDNSIYFRREYPKWASVRNFFVTDLWHFLPMFYFVYYLPFLACFWVFNHLFAGTVARIGFGLFTSPGGILTRYDSVASIGELTTLLQADLWSVALLPLSIPYNIFTGAMNTSLGSAIGALIGSLFSLFAIGCFAFILIALIRGTVKVILRVILT